MPGCTTAVSTLQPAHVLRPGQIHLGAGMDGNIPVSRIYSVIDTAGTIEKKYQADSAYQPTEQDRRDLMKAAAGLALNAPGVNLDLMGRYGVFNPVDIGLRYSTTGVHGDIKAQFLGKGDGTTWDGSVSVGYSRQLYKGAIFDTLEYVKIDDFSRNNLEVPILFGKRFGEWGFVWMGPKYIFSRYHVDVKLQNVQLTDKTDGSIHYVGGFAGVGLGYKWFHLFGELTAMYMFARPIILGQQTNIGGLLIAPSVGLMARF
jgi:hypothetical protein